MKSTIFTLLNEEYERINQLRNVLPESGRELTLPYQTIEGQIETLPESCRELNLSHHDLAEQIKIIRELHLAAVNNIYKNLKNIYITKLNSGVTATEAFRSLTLAEILIICRKHETIGKFVKDYKLKNYGNLSHSTVFDNLKKLALSWKVLQELNVEFITKVNNLAAIKNIAVNNVLDIELNEFFILNLKTLLPQEPTTTFSSAETESISHQVKRTIRPSEEPNAKKFASPAPFYELNTVRDEDILYGLTSGPFLFHFFKPEDESSSVSFTTNIEAPANSSNDDDIFAGLEALMELPEI